MKNKLTEDKSGLLSKIGLFTTIAIVVGAMVGSGIFKKPAVIAEQVGSPEIMLLIWVAAGVITLFGALSNAEVASIIPRTGGQYVYFKEMYGDFAAYLYGWAIFAVIQTGSIASITYVFAHYASYFFGDFLTAISFSPETADRAVVTVPFIGHIYPLANFGEKLLTAFIICFLSGVNYLGVKFGGRISAIFSSMKIAAILIIVILGFSLGGGSVENFTSSPIVEGGSVGLLSGIIVALSAAFWSYDGWNNVTYISGEVKRPQKNIPTGLIVGTIIVIGVYLIINLAFLYVMPIEEMAGSRLIASDVARKFMTSPQAKAVFGFLGSDEALAFAAGGIVAAAVMISTFGTSNGTIMVSARVYFAMARDKMFFKSIGDVQPKFKTPGNALILQAVWASLLVFSGTFDILTDMLIFVSWIFYMLGAVGLFVLRKKYPKVERPYKVIGYPIIPAIFIIFALAFVAFTLYNDIESYVAGKNDFINSVFGLVLVGVGIPFYFLFGAGKHKKRRSDHNEFKN